MFFELAFEVGKAPAKKMNIFKTNKKILQLDSI